MRIRSLVLMTASVLASAGVAAAQTMVEVPKPLVVPQGSHNGPSTPGLGIPDRHYNYLMKVETLREKLVRTEAMDGGRLTPEHATSLQHELDKLNRVYGVRTD